MWTPSCLWKIQQCNNIWKVKSEKNWKCAQQTVSYGVLVFIVPSSLLSCFCYWLKLGNGNNVIQYTQIQSYSYSYSYCYIGFVSCCSPYVDFLYVLSVCRFCVHDNIRVIYFVARCKKNSNKQENQIEFSFSLCVDLFRTSSQLADWPK